MKRNPLSFSLIFATLCAGPASAHTAEQGFVLLLPTTAYTVAGVMAVLLTIIALFMLPASAVRDMFRVKTFPTPDLELWKTALSLISFGLMLFLLTLGFIGPRSPLANLMSLGFWTIGWIILVSLSGVFGNLWVGLNPWSGPYRLLGRPGPLIALPKAVGLWPATTLLIGFAAFLLADIAPEDPARLAVLVGFYWVATFSALIIFGPDWLVQGELGHAIFNSYARLAPVRFQPYAGIGGPGWQLIIGPTPKGLGIFALTLLAVGSFDGLNETYWWLGLIGVNPLEFPGRSAVVGATLAGVVFSIIALVLVFSVTIWLGLRIARSDASFFSAFGQLALSLLPIALVYHIAHYLTSFLVSIQYTILALSDPFKTGTDWLGIQPFQVTTGFFNNIQTVSIIWLTQAGLVVMGHIWSVLLSHRLALQLFGDNRRAALATLPLSAFMIGYTFLGLWLLASPRGA